MTKKCTCNYCMESFAGHGEKFNTYSLNGNETFIQNDGYEDVATCEFCDDIFPVYELKLIKFK